MILKAGLGDGARFVQILDVSPSNTVSFSSSPFSREAFS